GSGEVRVEVDGRPEGGGRAVEVAGEPGQLAEVVVGEGGVAWALGRLAGQAEEPGGAGQVTLELAGVGGAGVGGDAGGDVEHALEGLEGFRVAAELEKRVAEDTQRGRVPGIDRLGPARPPEAVGEAMPGVGQPTPSGEGEVIPVRVEGQ